MNPLPRLRSVLLIILVVSMVMLLAPRLESRGNKDAIQYGVGLIVNVPAPEEEVLQAVKEVVQSGIIRGSKEYNKDEYISGANQATDSRLFPAWAEGGNVFYKVRLHALDPRNFKDGGDIGTLAVRYVVMGQNEKSTVLRIDAVFAEDFRHTVHASNGSVESSEYKDIHDHIEAIELTKHEGAEAQKNKDEAASRRFSEATSDPGSAIPSQQREGTLLETQPEMAVAAASPQSLEQRVQELRRQTERVVKAPGAPLRSAPFHSASTLQTLPAGAEILILVSTPYWYGVETHEGQHGWMLRFELEELQ